MKLKLIAAILVSMLAANVASGQTASSDASQAAPVQDSKTIRIARSESLQSNKGSDQFFTGSVQVQQLFPGHDPARTSGGRVTFEPGARSAWHTHPLGQILIVTDGTGWIQQWGGPIEEIRKGDVIWIPPGVKHWHGATPTTAMTHIAIQEQLNGKAVKWLEKVTDEQYRKSSRFTLNGGKDETDGHRDRGDFPGQRSVGSGPANGRREEAMPAIQDITPVAPALEKYAQGPLADLWKRLGLTPRDRSIVTVAALIARNQTIEMPHYFNLALDNGVKPREISEIITHLAFYSGWANAMSAAAVAKTVFAERKIGADQLPAASPVLLPLGKDAEAKRAAAVEQQFSKVSPGLVQNTTDVLFRDLWLRPDLAPRDRSLVTVSALIASGQSAQITYHLNRAMDNGLTPEEAGEVVTHLAFYSGWPNAFSALPVVKDVIEKRGR